jgi:hypothetical protein
VSDSSIRVSEALMAELQRAADVEQRSPEEVVEDSPATGDPGLLACKPWNSAADLNNPISNLEIRRCADRWRRSADPRA